MILTPHGICIFFVAQKAKSGLGLGRLIVEI